MQFPTLGLDLAKTVFQVHGITKDDTVVFNRPLRRAQVLPFLAKLEPCLIGMDSCSTARHRARDLLVRQRTQFINGLRGLVAEFGIYIARGFARVIGFAEDITFGEVLDLPDIANEVIRNLSEQLMALHKRSRWYKERLKQIAKEDERVRLLRTIPGVGVVTASATGISSRTAERLPLGWA